MASFFLLFLNTFYNVLEEGEAAEKTGEKVQQPHEAQLVHQSSEWILRLRRKFCQEHQGEETQLGYRVGPQEDRQPDQDSSPGTEERSRRVRPQVSRDQGH